MREAPLYGSLLSGFAPCQVPRVPPEAERAITSSALQLFEDRRVAAGGGLCEKGIYARLSGHWSPTRSEMYCVITKLNVRWSGESEPQNTLFWEDIMYASTVWKRPHALGSHLRWLAPLPICALLALPIHAQPLPSDARFYEDTQPPYPSDRTELPNCGRIQPNGAPRTLGAAARNLSNALSNAGYTDVGWFLTHQPLSRQGAPDSSQVNGFALVTRMRVVVPPQPRWPGPIVRGAPLPRERVFAFFVVNGPVARSIEPPGEGSYDHARAWYRVGSPTQFSRLDEMPWPKRAACLALVYAFDEVARGKFVLIDNVDAREQLQEARIWQFLVQP